MEFLFALMLYRVDIFDVSCTNFGINVADAHATELHIHIDGAIILNLSF